MQTSAHLGSRPYEALRRSRPNCDIRMVAQMIVPRILHQVWIGPHDPPLQWMNGWRSQGWEYRLWREQDIDDLNIASRRLYERYCADQRWCGAVNAARVEILAHFGGVYIDADIEHVADLDGAPWLDSEMFAVQSIHQSDRISNAVMGCVPGNPGMVAYRRALSRLRTWRRRSIHPSWIKTGAGMLGVIASEHQVEVVPAGAFFPETMDGVEVPYDGKVYGRHYFGTTRGLYSPEQ